MTDPNSIETLLEGSQPAPPAAVAPAWNELQRRVARRRRRRKIARAAALTLSLVFALASLSWYRSSHTAANAGEEKQSNPEPTALVKGAQRGLNQPSRHEASAPSSPFRLFAKVSRPVPVFGLEQETQLLHLVGWVDSEEVVPVDVTRIPAEQQASIEAVLNENDTDQYFNL